MGFFQDDKGKIGLEPIDKGRRMPNRGKQPHGNGRMAPLRSWKASQYYTERFRALLSVFYYGDLSNFNVNNVDDAGSMIFNGLKSPRLV